DVGGDNTGGAPGGPPRPRRAFACPECGRGFAYLSYLQRHSIAHSPHKPHVCRACGKAFKRLSHLERHRFTHTGHAGGTGKAPACPPCPLARHRRGHGGGGGGGGGGERPFPCPLCPRRFGDRGALRRHRRGKHPGDGP
ncbi:ZN581 protein, partial [Chaetorhynchus papuensis]|nr:ZN581 protein [Chaetorhynchus papuensis]